MNVALSSYGQKVTFTSTLEDSVMCDITKFHFKNNKSKLLKTRVCCEKRKTGENIMCTFSLGMKVTCCIVNAGIALQNT